jgi:Protein related to penicillin acylase
MVVEDELGIIAKDFYEIKPLFLEKILRNYENASDWCDIKHSNKKENCSLLAKESLEESVILLKNLYGSDISSWRWGESNTLIHSSFSFPNIPIPKFLRDITHEMPGGRFTLNSSWSEKGIGINERPKASGFRMIIDFSELDKSMFIISTGQSGHFLSKNYDDLTNLWKQGDYINISTNLPIILGGSKGKIVISPTLVE